MPIEYFLIDPAMPVPPGMGLPNRGVSIHQRPGPNGAYDVYDRVGESGYPHVADFIEETRRLGLSRRIATNADFSKLDSQSRIILAHPKAVVVNAEDMYGALVTEHLTYAHHHPWRCICGLEAHEAMLDIPDFETCASLWYETVTGGEESFDPDDFPRTVDCRVGHIRYKARRPPSDLRVTFAEGFFLRLPIHRLAVIRDPAQGRDEGAMERASASGLPVVLEDA